MPKLIIMVGNIASGKSTWIAEQLKSAPPDSRPIVVSKDAIRRMLNGGQYLFIQNREWLVHRIALEAIELAMACPHQNNGNIIYDETNETRDIRRPFITLAKKYGYTVIAQVMPIVPLKESLVRRCGEADEAWGIQRRIWFVVYQQKALDYEPPSLDEGFDSIKFCGKGGSRFSTTVPYIFR